MGRRNESVSNSRNDNSARLLETEKGKRFDYSFRFLLTREAEVFLISNIFSRVYLRIEITLVR